jgi:antitoxin YefM
MNTLTIHPADMNQETAIRLFLDALHVSYNATEKEMDETEYLSASPAMKEHLDKAAQQEKNGEGVKITLDDIWK